MAKAMGAGDVIDVENEDALERILKSRPHDFLEGRLGHPLLPCWIAKFKPVAAWIEEI